MFSERSEKRARVGVPDTNGVVIAAADDPCPVWRVGDRFDAVRMSPERSDERAVADVPDSNRSIVASAGDFLSVWRIGDRIDFIRMPYQRLRSLRLAAMD